MLKQTKADICTVADTICNIYSSALSIQLLGQHFIAIPRFVLCTIISLVIFALAYSGRYVLEEILNDLLSILGYWTLAFALIIFIEDFWFRPRLGGYDLSAWQDPKLLPVGLAGTVSLLIGIGFSFLGMDQTWVRFAPVFHLCIATRSKIYTDILLVCLSDSKKDR